MFSLIVVAVVVILLIALWRMLGPDGSRPTTRPPRRRPERGTAVPPDDNPEFLRDLDRRARPEE